MSKAVAIFGPGLWPPSGQGIDGFVGKTSFTVICVNAGRAIPGIDKVIV